MSGAAMATDLEDLKSLYIEHYSPLLRRAERKLADRTEAEDFVHESFLRAAERVDLSGVNNPRAYLMKVLDNAISNGIRANAKISVGLGELEVVDVREVGSAFDLAERRRLVSEALNALIPKQQRVLEMFSQGTSLATIADLEKSTRHKVSCTLTRAKENLGKELIRRGFVPGVVPTAAFPRMRLALTNIRVRLFDFVGKLERSAAIPAALVATVALTSPLGPISRVPAAAAPPSVSSKLPVDPSSLIGASNRVASAISTATHQVAPLLGMAKRAGMGRSQPNEPAPDDPFGPLGHDPTPQTGDLVQTVQTLAADPAQVLPTCDQLGVICP